MYLIDFIYDRFFTILNNSMMMFVVLQSKNKDPPSLKQSSRTRFKVHHTGWCNLDVALRTPTDNKESRFYKHSDEC